MWLRIDVGWLGYWPLVLDGARVDQPNYSMGLGKRIGCMALGLYFVGVQINHTVRLIKNYLDPTRNRQHQLYLKANHLH